MIASRRGEAHVWPVTIPATSVPAHRAGVELWCAGAELDTEKHIELYHKMQQQAWDRSPIVFIPQENNVALARKNIVGFHLGSQPDFIRYDKTWKI